MVGTGGPSHFLRKTGDNAYFFMNKNSQEFPEVIKPRIQIAIPDFG